MKHSSSLAMGAGLVLASSLLVGAFAQDTTNTVKQGIGRGPAVQKSVPSKAAPPTPTRHTGATNQSGNVKSMNNEAKQKVETEGK